MTHDELTDERLRQGFKATESDATIIRAQVAERCKSLGLTPEQSTECENHALSIYWLAARSNGWCVASGVQLAHDIAKRVRERRVPDEHFCCQREKCIGLLRCPRDPVCND